MKRFSKMIALFLALVMLMSGCGSSTASYANTVAATYGDRTIYLDEANFWLRFSQMGYSYYMQIYQQYYGITDFWGMSSGNRSQTMEESLKEEIMAQFLQQNILLDHETEFDTALTDEENKKIDEFIAELRADYGDDLFNEQVCVISDEKLRETFVQRTKALKVWKAVREQTVTTVSDEDAKCFTVEYFQITSSTSETPSGESAALSGEDLATYLANRMNSDETLAHITKDFSSSLTSGTKSYRWNDESTQTNVLNRVGRTLTEGKATAEKDGETWYVVRLLSADDKDAAADARATLEDEQKDAHFNEVYAEWAKSAKKFTVKKVFNDLKMVLN